MLISFLSGPMLRPICCELNLSIMGIVRNHIFVKPHR